MKIDRVLCRTILFLFILLLCSSSLADYTVNIPEGMAFVPKDGYIFGSNLVLDEKPLRKEHLGAFFIDFHEVTNAEFKKFKRSHYFPPASSNRPATNLSWSDAAAYARWVGKRLPTEREWEKAARGEDGRRYPWGEKSDPSKLNSSSNRLFRTVPVMSYPDGVSPYGAYDMAGNVWEWTSTECESEDCPEGGYLVKGGSWDVAASVCRTSNKLCIEAGTFRPDVGFRCVTDISPDEWFLITRDNK